MNESRPSRAASAQLAVGESASQLVIGYLLDGKLEVEVVIDGKAHRGYVHNMDFARGAEYVFANVEVPELEGGVTVRVGIYRDGRVQVLPDYDEK